MRRLWISFWQGGEALLLTALALGVGFWLSPQDPFGVHAAFPWVWLVVVLLALRYGTAAGLGSAALLLGIWLLGQRWGWFAGFPKSFFLGGALLAFVCGEYRDFWQGRWRQAEGCARYLSERLEVLTHSLYLLRLSHERLEQSLIGQPLTLREALSRLRTLALSEGEALPAPLAERFVRLLAQYFQLEAAGIYRLEGQKGVLLAQVGSMGPLHLEDPLVHYALQENALCHVAEGAREKASVSRYLVVAPLKASGGQVLAWLVVEQMPFLALHHEALQMLMAFLGYFADSLEAQHRARPILEVFPDCPLLFAAELLKLYRLKREAGIESHGVLWMAGPDPHQQEVLRLVRESRRGLDLLWETQREGCSLLVVLMPFARRAAVEGYLARIRRLVEERWGQSYEGVGVRVSVRELGGDEALCWLKNFVALPGGFQDGKVAQMA